MSNNICLFNKNGNRLCLSLKAYTHLQNKVAERFKLNFNPDLNAILKLLKIKNALDIQPTVSAFLKETGYEEDVDVRYKYVVPSISNNGLSGLSVIKILDKLMHLYPNFLYRGPCLLDYEFSRHYNYSNFQE